MPPKKEATDDNKGPKKRRSGRPPVHDSEDAKNESKLKSTADSKKRTSDYLKKKKSI